MSSSSAEVVRTMTGMCWSAGSFLISLRTSRPPPSGHSQGRVSAAGLITTPYGVDPLPLGCLSYEREQSWHLWSIHPTLLHGNARASSQQSGSVGLRVTSSRDRGQHHFHTVDQILRSERLYDVIVGSASAELDRNALHTSTPDICGIIQSRSTTSGRSMPATVKPAAPSDSRWTSNPARSSINTITSPKSGSSSTTSATRILQTPLTARQ
jgi:hypothetical protein